MSPFILSVCLLSHLRLHSPTLCSRRTKWKVSFAEQKLFANEPAKFEVAQLLHVYCRSLTFSINAMQNLMRTGGYYRVKVRPTESPKNVDYVVSFIPAVLFIFNVFLTSMMPCSHQLTGTHFVVLDSVLFSSPSSKNISCFGLTTLATLWRWSMLIMCNGKLVP